MKSSWAYILAPLLGYITAHTIKYFLQPKGQRTWRRWVRSGNFPSSHTAVVVALLAAIFVHEGVSNLFAVAATFASIVVYDAMSMRRSVGEQGKVLNRLIEKFSPKETPAYISLGHSAGEVGAGVALGVVVGVTVALFITV